ncbi:methyltransferase domain-containing protein [Sulfitobacter aestuariivivens]
MQEDFSGDLGRKFTPPVTEPRERLRGAVMRKRIGSNGMKGGNNGILILLESPDALTDKTLLIFGDSFFRQLLHHLCFFYRRVIFCRTRFFHYEMVDAFQPDHIFCGVAERYLSDVLPDDERPHFLAYPLVLGRAIEPDPLFPALWQKFVAPGSLTHAPQSDAVPQVIPAPELPEPTNKGPNHMNLNALDVIKTIDDKDGMSKGMIDYYFVTGRSAMVAMKKTLQVAGRTPESITRVLDYACGYGRVLRWLLAAFPQSKVIGVDVDARAVASAQRILSADTRVLDTALTEPLDAPFDLIWVGSLFTHLNEAEALRVLRYLRDHLLPGGMAVITTHGDLVEGRLRTRERNYSLSEKNIARLIDSYDETDYGFAPYDGHESYGISLANEAKMTELIEKVGMKVIHFEAAGWVLHQDVFGIQRPE